MKVHDAGLGLLAAPVSGASQARGPLQTRPRGRGLGAFEDLIRIWLK
jgi:hypothetical protein